MENIGKRIREARKKCGYTMAKLHELTGLSTGHISDIENGHNMPTATSLIPLSRVFGCSIDWLLTGEEEIRKTECLGMTDEHAISLTDDEADLIMMYKLLDIKDKQEIFTLTRLKYNWLQEGAVESVFSTYTVTNRNPKNVENDQTTA